MHAVTPPAAPNAIARRRCRAGLLAMACGVLLGAARVALAQQLADPFNDSAAGGTVATGPAARPNSGPLSTMGPAYVPTVPKAVSRPQGWPGGGEAVDAEKHVLSSIRARPGAPLDPWPAADEGVVRAAFEAPAGDATPALPEAKSLEAAMVVARVGPEVVLEADLLTPKALEWLEKVTPGLPPEQVRALRLQICQQVIAQHIETLLVYVDACREIPADKLPEIRKNVDKAFDEQQLPRLLKEANSPNTLEYEKSLRARGMSLDRMRKMFFERGLAQEWMRKNTKTDEEVPHADLIAWYQNHLDDYDYPAKARFEALTVKTGLKRSRKQAWDLLAAMGNEVLAGRDFGDVARARSEGPTAAQGGSFDWTNKGSLAAQKLDEVVFTLPAGQLSSIIEDGEALHIVRVVERTEAGRVPFLEAQVGIKEALLEERRKTAADEYLAKIRERTPVWTIFDAGTATDPQFTAGRPGGSTTRR
jgi:parvulin-like peptidyl-prolyl isomerase